MEQSKIDLLLNSSQFPKTNLKELPKPYKHLLKFTGQLHIVCNGLSFRKLAKDISILCVNEYLKNYDIKCSPFYLNKFQFIEGWRDYLFGKDHEKVDKWRNAPFLVFDGIDEASSVNEMLYIASFLTNFIYSKKPVIIISSGNLDEFKLKEFNATSFGVLLMELEVLELGK